MPEHHEAAAAFDQRDDRAGAVNAKQQVTLPVTGHGPVRSFSGRFLMLKPSAHGPRGTDRTGRRRLGVGAPAGPAAARPGVSVPGAGRRVMHVEGLVDRLV
jgi:hypothetical protein